MKAHEIRELVKIVEDSDIDELEVSRWGHKIRITKAQNHTANGVQQITVPTQAPQAAPVQQSQPQQSQPQPQQAAGSKDTAEPEETETGGTEKNNWEEVKSPIVGTFYRSPSPEDPPYAKIGDNVEPGQTLCIIEAMKIMNEIEAEISGTIKDILVEDSQAVEYNQTLFLIEP